MIRVNPIHLFSRKVDPVGLISRELANEGICCHGLIIIPVEEIVGVLLFGPIHLTDDKSHACGASGLDWALFLHQKTFTVVRSKKNLYSSYINNTCEYILFS